MTESLLLASSLWIPTLDDLMIYGPPLPIDPYIPISGEYHARDKRNEKHIFQLYKTSCSIFLKIDEQEPLLNIINCKSNDIISIISDYAIIDSKSNEMFFFLELIKEYQFTFNYKNLTTRYISEVICHIPKDPTLKRLGLIQMKTNGENILIVDLVDLQTNQMLAIREVQDLEIKDVISFISELVEDVSGLYQFDHFIEQFKMSIEELALNKEIV